MPKCDFNKVALACVFSYIFAACFQNIFSCETLWLATFIPCICQGSVMENSNTIPCACSKFDRRYIDRKHKYILTRDLEIISRAKLKLVYKNLRYENLLIYPENEQKHKLSFA